MDERKPKPPVGERTPETKPGKDKAPSDRANAAEPLDEKSLDDLMRDCPL
jgi:hypothetical protein